MEKVTRHGITVLVEWLEPQQVAELYPTLSRLDVKVAYVIDDSEQRIGPYADGDDLRAAAANGLVTVAQHEAFCKRLRGRTMSVLGPFAHEANSFMKYSIQDN